MEVAVKKYKLAVGSFLIAFLFCINSVQAQPSNKYTISNGRMIIQLAKGIKEAVLDSFILQFELAELDLKNLLRTNKPDSINKLGWQIEKNNEIAIIISKKLESLENLIHSGNRVEFIQYPIPDFPITSASIKYGVNHFINKPPFLQKDSIVRFYLRNNQRATTVLLAGSFTNWEPGALIMNKTDSGWIADVPLKDGKYWYKFIVDGNWIADADNKAKENDGQGNINSVFFKSNTLFKLEGYRDAKKVYLSGSFNHWKPKELLMVKTAHGWELPLYLNEGTHTYKYVVDGKWILDESTPKLPDGKGSFNSVLQIGTPHIFKLNGFNNAQKVILAGTFNDWKEDELQMKKSTDGWEFPYVLAPGNYEYKFIVDGKWMQDPGNEMQFGEAGNSYLIIKPNYIFRLKGFSGANQVALSGDFNNWDPKGYAMKKEGEEWIFPVYLPRGKHLYKYLVDGKWIIDPQNELWEQNEYGTGNSVLWIEK